MENNKPQPLFTLQHKGGKAQLPLHARDGQNIYLKYNFENQTNDQVQELVTMTKISAPSDKEK